MAKNKLTIELITRHVGRQGVRLENIKLSDDTEWEQAPPSYPIGEAMNVSFIARAKTDGKDAVVSFQVTGTGTANITAFNRGKGCDAQIQCDGLRAERDYNRSDANRIVINIDRG